MTQTHEVKVIQSTKCSENHGIRARNVRPSKLQNKRVAKILCNIKVTLARIRNDLLLGYWVQSPPFTLLKNHPYKSS